MVILHVEETDSAVIVDYVYNSYAETFTKTYKYLSLCGKKLSVLYFAHPGYGDVRCDTCMLLQFERDALKAKQPFPVQKTPVETLQHSDPNKL